jgi:hypothetical protein
MFFRSILFQIYDQGTKGNGFVNCLQGKIRLYKYTVVYCRRAISLCVQWMVNANNVPRSDPGSRHALSEGDRLESETEPFQPSQAQQEH